MVGAQCLPNAKSLQVRDEGVIFFCLRTLLSCRNNDYCMRRHIIIISHSYDDEFEEYFIL